MGYKGVSEFSTGELPSVELREENGVTCAYDSNGKEVCIPSFPKSMNDADLGEWLRGCSITVLEAARLYYYDRWLWDTGEQKYLDLVGAIEVWQRVRHSNVDTGIVYAPYIPL